MEKSVYMRLWNKRHVNSPILAIAAAVCMFGLAVEADMTIKLKDGRQFNIPIDAADIESMYFLPSPKTPDTTKPKPIPRGPKVVSPPSKSLPRTFGSNRDTVTGPGNSGPATVCREGCPFNDLQKALKATKPGGTITIAPGLYGFCGVIKKSLTITGLKGPNGKRAHFAGGICWGKGPIVATAPNIVIQGLEISNVSVGDKNGACIRIDRGASNLLIKDIYCHDSQNGVLGGPKSGQLIIEDSVFERNGFNNGRAHGIYINHGDLLIVRRVHVLSSKEGGHSLKSGARHTIVEDSILAALEGRNSRAIDLYGGGVLEVRRSVIQQGANTDNHEAFGIALEPRRINPEPHSTLIENSWIIFDDLKRCCRWLIRGKKFGPVVVRNNRIVGMTDLRLAGMKMAENKLFRDRTDAGLHPFDGTVKSLPTVDW